MTTAAIIGSGPNGLAAAAKLAVAGVDVTVYEAADRIGGGVRSEPMFDSGVVVDHCSAVHMLAVNSPLIRELELHRHGLEWLAPPIDMVHPLDAGDAGVLHRSVDRTADGLGDDDRRWRRMFGSLARHHDALASEVLGPVLHLPRHPFVLARFGVGALLPATVMARLFSTEQARALWAGVAAHTFAPLTQPVTSAIALMMIAAGHANGWVVAKGGSQSIADAMAAVISAHSGRFETGAMVSSLDAVAADIVMLDTSPSAAARIVGDRLPERVRRAYENFEHGAGAFKVDFAVDGGVPWAAPDARRAGTVHLGGTLEQIAAAERDVAAGRMPEQPFVLVGQQYLADPGRSAGDIHPVWSYAHVPAGYTGDATGAITAQIERFAPGFRDRIVDTAVRSTTETARYNPNHVGGDIAGGATTPTGLVFRPRFALDPYSTGVPGVYLCSSSTPPGAGAHGMCGAHAAQRALAAFER